MKWQNAITTLKSISPVQGCGEQYLIIYVLFADDSVSIEHHAQVASILELRKKLFHQKRGEGVQSASNLLPYAKAVQKE